MILVWLKQIGFEAEIDSRYSRDDESGAKARFAQLLSYPMTLKVWYEIID